MPENRLNKRAGLIRTVNARIADLTTKNALQELGETIDRMSKDGTRLSLDEAKKLLKLYARSGVQLKKKHDTVTMSGTGEAELYLKLMKKMTKDYMALNRYIKNYEKRVEDGKNVEPLTIEQFYEASRTRTVSLNGKSLSEMERKGDGTSYRYMITVPYKDEPLSLSEGDTFKAYFTENISYDPDMTEQEIMVSKEKEIVKQVVEKYPAMKGLLGPKRPGENSGLFKDLKALQYTEIGQFLRKNTETLLAVKGTDKALDYLHRTLGQKSVRAEAYLEKIEMQEPKKRDEMLLGFLTYTQAAMKTFFIQGVRKGGGISQHTAMGKRNALMSEMADLFGCSDVLAFSEKVNIRSFENGKEVVRKGIVMMPASGEDMAHAGLTSNSAKLDRTKLEESPELTKKIASIQFLDLICGNVDRHRFNMFYQYDENGKMTGVQGIDNDTAFVSKDVDPSEVVGYAVRFKDLRIIPKSMADVMKTLDEDTFAVFLQGYELTKDEIDVAVERFSWLKESLDRIEKKYEGAAPGYLDPAVPRIVPDEEMELYSFNEQLTTHYGEKDQNSHKNIFETLANACHDRQASLIDQIISSNEYMVSQAYEFNEAFVDKSRGSLTGNLAVIDRQNQAMQKKDKEFETMLKNTRSLLDSPKIREKLIGVSNVTAGNPDFGGSHIYIMNVGKKVNKDVPTEEATLSKGTREVLDTEVYKKLNKALESTYEYLNRDSSVAIADKYQQLQMDLAEASKENRDGILEELNKLKESQGFKRYMTAVTNRDRLQEQMERFVKLKEESDALVRSANRYDSYFAKEDSVKDPYEGSKMQQDAIRRKENAKTATNLGIVKSGDKPQKSSKVFSPK